MPATSIRQPPEVLRQTQYRIINYRDDDDEGDHRAKNLWWNFGYGLENYIMLAMFWNEQRDGRLFTQLSTM